MKYLALLFFVLMMQTTRAQKKIYLINGSYTNGASKGIYVYRFNQANGSAVLVDSAVTANPSFLAIAPNKKWLYAVNELGSKDGGGKVSAFRFDGATGRLQFINDQPSGGDHPCYVSVDDSARWVVAGNYSGGNFSILPVRSDGSLGTPAQTIQHRGSSVTQRQQSAHVHATVFAPNRQLLITDLGMDRLLVYGLDANKGTVRPVPDTAIVLPPGSGPRHLTLHKAQPWLYLLNELSGTIHFYGRRMGRYGLQQTISALPNGFTQSFTAADIHLSPDGLFLYASLRDDANLLAIFSVQPKTGKLKLVGHQPVLGKTPRNFSIDPSGNYLLVANQNSNEIVVFRRNKKTGRLTDTGQRIATGNPVCLKWIEE